MSLRLLSRLFSTHSAETQFYVCRYTMSKKTFKGKARQTQVTSDAECISKSTTSVLNQPITANENGGISLKVMAKPGAQISSITNVSEEGIHIQIAAPPTDGEANTELVKYLAKVLGLRKSDVTIQKGMKSRNKLVVISGALSIDELKDKVQSASDT